MCISGVEVRWGRADRLKHLLVKTQNIHICLHVCHTNKIITKRTLATVKHGDGSIGSASLKLRLGHYTRKREPRLPPNTNLFWHKTWQSVNGQDYTLVSWHICSGFARKSGILKSRYWIYILSWEALIQKDWELYYKQNIPLHVDMTALQNLFRYSCESPVLPEEHGTHCHVQESRLRQLLLCDMVHEQAGCRHGNLWPLKEAHGQQHI